MTSIEQTHALGGHQHKAAYDFTGYYLGGSSYPSMQHMESELRSRLSDILPDWVSQADILKRTNETGIDRNVPRRVASLRTVLPTETTASNAILLGFSSGARTASVFSAQHGARAVICMGYPFRVVRRLIEPARWTHLATVTVPTLIIQGVADPFGGLGITEDYEFSNAVSVRFVDADHDYVLTPVQWNSVAETIHSFLDSINQGEAFAPLPFDEDFYLSLYPELAEAARTGRIISGARHYREHGRTERRRFRYLPGV